MTSRRASTVDQYLTILKLQFVKIRENWFFYLMIPGVIAFGLVWLRARMEVGIDVGGQERYVAGAAMVAAMFASVNAVAHEAAWAKQTGEIEYLSSFPVGRTPVIFAMVSLPVLYGFVPVFTIVYAGRVLLDVEPSIHVFALLTLVGLQLMLCSAGLVLGLYLPVRLATSIGNALPLLLMVFSPLLLDPSRFPAGFEVVGRVLPTTIAADVLEASLFGSPGRSEAIKLGIVAVTAVVGICAAAKLPGWRETR